MNLPQLVNVKDASIAVSVPCKGPAGLVVFKNEDDLPAMVAARPHWR
jgi:hypothetical protein